jgi:E3 ubiquitin-protein ligase HUWE1
MLNLLVKNVFGASAREKDNYNKEMGTVTEYIKFMPHLLDFENKRVYFKREIKKMRRASYARDLVLSIRRKDIFMDAYS